jgi:pyruvate formate lyase activating enzyme
MKGIITEIQRFSLKDGPGIRTTVFFKGCNMRCDWCHNPETLDRAAQLLFYPSRCIACGRCFRVCPTGAHQMAGDRHVLDRSLCTNCGRCAEVCFAEALVMAGKEMTVDAVMHEVRQDLIYYQESGGGVTLSGGEVLCQDDFALALIEACRGDQIPVAIETNLFTSVDPLLRIAAKTDLVMFDIKLIDPDEHRRRTCADNALILKNAQALADTGVDLIVRTPLIPGVTDSAANIGAIAGFVAGLPHVLYYELLNFNPLGAAKYAGLGLDNPYADARPLSQAALEDLAGVASAKGVQVRGC